MAYLVVGVPLTAAFQVWVRKQPLLALWTRGAPIRPMGVAGWVLGAVLALIPLVVAVAAFATRDPSDGVEGLCAALGAFGLAWSLRQSRRATFADALRCLAIAGSIGIAIMVGDFLLSHEPLPPEVAQQLAELATLPVQIPRWVVAATVAIQNFTLLLPVTFVLEEVSFRGLLDAHLAPDANPLDWKSALLVSALWGLWHLPIAGATWKELPQTLALLLGVHIAVGIPLSLFWRKSGNLAVPGLSHALIDAVRNGLLVLRV